MLAGLNGEFNLARTLRPMAFYLKRPFRLFRTYDRENFRPDLIAGITVGVYPLAPSHCICHHCRFAPGDGALCGCRWRVVRCSLGLF